MRRRDQTNIQFYSFIQINRVSKNIYYIKTYTSQNIVKLQDPILNCSHISLKIFNPSWAAEARSEVLRKHQNVPAWTESWHKDPTLGLAGWQQRNVELFTCWPDHFWKCYRSISSSPAEKIWGKAADSSIPNKTAFGAKSRRDQSSAKNCFFV